MKCPHVIVIDLNKARPFYDPEWWRVCVECGTEYNRTEILERLRSAIWERNRLPKSPWAGNSFLE